MRFLKSHGFEHRQFSGYVSLDRLNYAETYVIIETLLDKHPWIGKCVKQFDVTDFMAESDAMEFIQEKTADVQVDDGIDDKDIF